MGVLFDQDIITKNYENEIFEQGMQQGMQQGELETFVKIYKKGMIKAEDAAKMLKISVGKFLKFPCIFNNNIIK